MKDLMEICFYAVLTVVIFALGMPPFCYYLNQYVHYWFN